MRKYCIFLSFVFFYPPEDKYCYEGQGSEGSKDEPRNRLTYDANIKKKEGPHVYVGCYLQNLALACCSDFLGFKIFTILRPGGLEFTKEDTSLKCPMDQQILIVIKNSMNMFKVGMQINLFT